MKEKKTFTLEEVRELDLVKGEWDYFVLETADNDLHFEMVEYRDKKGRDQRELYQIHLEGPWMFVTRHQKDFKEADYKNTYKPPQYKDEFTDRKTDYIVDPSKTIHKYKKPGDLKKILDDQNPVLVQFASQNGLDLTNRDDLIRSLQYLNSKY